ADGHSRDRARVVRWQEASRAGARARQVAERVQEGRRGRRRRARGGRGEAGVAEEVSVLGSLGPWWVARLLIVVALLGLAAALVARAKGRAFLPWLFYGVSLPLIALPHAIGIAPGRDEPVREAEGFLERRLAIRPKA